MASKAIVIGCAAYMSDGIPDLRYAEQDAHAIHARLIDPDVGGFDPKTTDLLISPVHVAASVQLEALLHGAAPDDSVVVYFAGHGLRDDRGQMYLAVTDTNPEFLRATSISARFVRELLDDCRSRKVCVILDCCFAGAFGQGHRSVLNARDVKAGLGTLEGEGTVVLTSSQASQQSRESEHHAHGIFTHYLLEGLDGAADTDDNGLITPVELYQFVSARMERDAGASQRPMMLGSLSGGSFPIARSSLKRQQALSNLEAEVESLVERREHGAALRRIQTFTPSTAKEEERLRVLTERLRSEMVRLLIEFKEKLYAEGGKGRLSGKVLHEADKILSSRGTYLFDEPGPAVKDHHELLLRNHFLGHISAKAMQDLWSKDSQTSTTPDSTDLALSLTRNGVVGVHRTTSNTPTRTPAPPDRDTSPAHAESSAQSVAAVPLRIAAAILCVSVLAIGFWVYLARTRGSDSARTTSSGTDTRPSTAADAPKIRPYNPADIRLGILLKTGWNNSNTRPTFVALAKQLTSLMQPHYKLKNDVQTFTDPKEVFKALGTGEIDVVGELAPWEIYQANTLAKASPFISARYDGSDTYNATVFMPGNSPWLIRTVTGINRVATWDKVLDRLDAGDKIAVSKDESTSGYWYPRYMVLRGFDRLNKQPRLFEDVAERMKDEEIFSSVACGAGSIIAGVSAKYKFEPAQKQRCGGVDVTLVSVRESDPIKQGAFVVRKELAEDATLMEHLRGDWQDAVGALPPDRNAITLEKAWQPVDMTYYENTKQVFELADPVVIRRPK